MFANLWLVAGALLIAGAMGVVVLSLGSLAIQRLQVRKSISTMSAMTAPADPSRRELQEPFTTRVVTPALKKLAGLGRQFTPADQSVRLQRRLDLAGNPQSWDVDRIVGFKVLGAITGALGGVLLGLVFSSGPLVTTGLFLASTTIGYFGPNIALYQVSYNRMQAISRALPDALDLLTISVEAGMPFDAAANQVATKTSGPLADEFSRLLQEVQIGLGRASAIRAMGERTDVAELRSFTSAMVQANRLGIPVAQVLRIQASEMRVKRSQRAEEAAQKVPVKILFPLIFCILPVLFIVVLGPALLSVFSTLGS